APDRADTDVDPFLFPDAFPEFRQRRVRLLRHQVHQHLSVCTFQLGAGSTTVRQWGQILSVASLPQEFVHIRGVNLKNACNLLNRAQLLVHRLHDPLSEFERIWLHMRNLSSLTLSTQAENAVTVLGGAYRLTGRQEEAITVLKKAISLIPNLLASHEILAV